MIYFISDLHLRSESDKVYVLLEKFLREKLQAQDHLVIGGDLFDLFVGDKKIFQQQFSRLLVLLNGLSQRKIFLHYFEGNHDFHLDGVLEPQVKLWSDAKELCCAGIKVWIAHGDRIDREDYGYRCLRFITRMAIVRGLVRALPDSWLSGLGHWSSGQSRKYNNLERMDNARTQRTKQIFREYAEQKARQGYHWIFLGHSHIADRVEFAETHAIYFNLGYSSQALLYAVGDATTRTLECKQYL